MASDTCKIQDDPLVKDKSDQVKAGGIWGKLAAEYGSMPMVPCDKKAEPSAVEFPPIFESEGSASKSDDNPGNAYIFKHRAEPDFMRFKRAKEFSPKD